MVNICSQINDTWKVIERSLQRKPFVVGVIHIRQIPSLMVSSLSASGAAPCFLKFYAETAEGKRYEGGTKARDNWLGLDQTTQNQLVSLAVPNPPSVLSTSRTPTPRLPQTAARPRKATAKCADQRRCHPRGTLSASLRPQTRMCNAVYSPAPRRAGLLGEHCVSGENRMFVSVMA